MQLGPSQAGRHRRDRRQGMAADRAEPHAAANQAAGNGPRETGTVIGFNSVDNWRWVRPKFATDAKALVTGAEIADRQACAPRPEYPPCRHPLISPTDNLFSGGSLPTE